MDVQFQTPPQAYGTVHILILVGIVLLSLAVFALIRRAEEKRLIRLLGVLGACMIAAEIFKLWFVSAYVHKGVASTWFFPWQLCSMAMYCSFAVPFLKGRAQDTVLVFLSTFSLIGAVFALAFPGDMMRPQIFLFCHSFLYHAVMVVESMAAMLILKKRSKGRHYADVPKAQFWPAILLFCAMALVAEAVNVVSHIFIEDLYYCANMFNITPFYPSTQPVFHEIALAIGIIPEIILYLGAVVLGAFIVYVIMYAGRRKRRA